MYRWANFCSCCGRRAKGTAQTLVASVRASLLDAEKHRKECAKRGAQRLLE